MNNDSEKENESLLKYYQHLEDECKSAIEAERDCIEKFKELCLVKGFELTDEDFSYIPTIGVIANAKGILSAFTENIPRDKDGLIEFDLLKSNMKIIKSLSGYAYGENCIAMAHSAFRRSFSKYNNYAPHFISLFWDFEDTKTKSYIALDEDRVRVDMHHSIYMEFDTWYGAPFNQEIAKISNGISKLCPPQDIDDMFLSFIFSDNYALDIKWSQQGSIKTFQAEEFKTEKVQCMRSGEKFYPARYIHAEFDLDAGTFRHFDGAIHYYKESDYFNRRGSDFNYNLKNINQLKSPSEKVFKFNGVISVSAWVEFCCHFFASNPLIHEYFSGKYPSHVIDALEKISNINNSESI